MNYTRCRHTLRKYFSNIVYIDDVFDTSLVAENKSEVETAVFEKEAVDGGIPLTQDAAEINDMLEIALPIEPVNEQKINPLADLLISLSHYHDVQLTPVFFNSSSTIDLAVSKMITAPLSIIDWDLGSKLDAYDVIKKLFTQTSQLKVIVIYTNGFDSAFKELDQKFGKGQYRPINMQNHIERIKCVQYDKSKSLIMIAEKTSVNLKQILTAIEDCFLDTYGTMPIALLDMAAQIDQRSGDLFGAFCAPLDGMYFLQNYYSSADKADKYEFQNNLTLFLLNKIKADAQVDIKIIDDVYDYMRNRLVCISNINTGELEVLTTLLKNKVSEKARSYCNKLAEIHLEKYQSNATALHDIELHDWKSILDTFLDGFSGTIKR